MSFQQKSWWLEDIADTIQPNPSLKSRKNADVVIIGGGFTGLSTAIHLKELNPNLDVRILEGEVCGYGASGRNGGFSMTLFGLTKGITKFRFGREKAIAAHHYMEEAVDYLDEFISGNKLDCDYENSGYLLVATNDGQVKRLEHEFKLMEDWGITGTEKWSEAKLKTEFNTDFYKLGWFERRCGIIQPAKLTREMKRLAEAKGVIIYEKSPMQYLGKNSAGEFIVSTNESRIKSEYLVFATNAYSNLFPKLKKLQTPVFTHIVMTEPLSDAQLESIGWHCRAGVEDARDLIHYYRLTADNRIVMGGGDVSVAFGKNFDKDGNDKIFKHLEEHITEIFPQLAGIKITHRWGGPVSITVDMAPAIGYIGKEKKAIYSVGCMGHGVSTTTYNGKTIAELICKEKTKRTEAFFVGRRVTPLPPEPFRYGMTQTVRGLIKLEDRLRYA